mmetsp:Transcript_16080/g.46058  ORF Transcript_16080/g.46058 Transcript_16080/m.46058 type:complete len:408 (-) Transcript_16080:637-1860(-)
MRQLALPVHDHRVGNDDQMRPPVVFVLHQVGDQRHDLHRLAEPHLVGKDAVQVIVVQRNHPLQSHDLILAQLGAIWRTEQLGLLRDLLRARMRELVVPLLGVCAIQVAERLLDHAVPTLRLIHSYLSRLLCFFLRHTPAPRVLDRPRRRLGRLRSQLHRRNSAGQLVHVLLRIRQKLADSVILLPFAVDPRRLGGQHLLIGVHTVLFQRIQPQVGRITAILGSRHHLLQPRPYKLFTQPPNVLVSVHPQIPNCVGCAHHILPILLGSPCPRRRLVRSGLQLLFRLLDPNLLIRIQHCAILLLIHRADRCPGLVHLLPKRPLVLQVLQANILRPRVPIPKRPLHHRLPRVLRHSRVRFFVRGRQATHQLLVLCPKLLLHRILILCLHDLHQQRTLRDPLTAPKPHHMR